MDVWQVYPRPAGSGGTDSETKLGGEALLVEKSESGGGLICWCGKNYRWQQHGD